MKDRKIAILFIENYIKWKKLKKEQVWDIFDIIHLSHKGNRWKDWIWDDIAQENNIDEDLYEHIDRLELTIRIFNIQIEEIKGCSRIKFQKISKGEK